ncbi:hypothetical protein DsansV1_C31g0217871 [Dioscorea sansibarensis]
MSACRDGDLAINDRCLLRTETKNLAWEMISFNYDSCPISVNEG